MCISVTITDLFINDYITFSVYMNPFRSTDKDMGITAVLLLRTIQKKFINLFFFFHNTNAHYIFFLFLFTRILECSYY